MLRINIANSFHVSIYITPNKYVTIAGKEGLGYTLFHYYNNNKSNFSSQPERFYTFTGIGFHRSERKNRYYQKIKPASWNGKKSKLTEKRKQKKAHETTASPP